MSDIHTCGYYCDRLACIKAQRDELRDKFQVMQAQALQSGEPVVFTCHGNNAPAYGCNKPGDMSGTYYKAPQPVVTDGYALITKAKLKYFNDHHHATETAIGVARLKLAENKPDEAMKWLDKCCVKLDDYGKALLSAGKGGE